MDEATNSLDANNERAIVENLAKFYQGKTVVVVAHRLSTVRDADQIIVLHQGKVVETGNHETLIARKELTMTLSRYWQDTAFVDKNWNVIKDKLRATARRYRDDTS